MIIRIGWIIRKKEYRNWSVLDGVWNYSFEIILGGFDIKSNGFLFNIWVTYNDHDVCAACEFINKCSKLLVSDNHWLELEAGLNAAEFKLLDDIWYLLKPVHVFMSLGIMMRDYQECWSLKEHYLICIDGLAELFQILFESFYVG